MIHPVVLAFVALALSVGRGAVSAPSCPGFSTPVESPYHRWAIECVPKPDNDKQHRLVLRDLRSGQQTDLRSFDRWAEVWWSPSGTLLAVTDGEGSNVTNSFVYAPGAAAAPQDVLDLFEQQVPSQRRAFLNGKDHVYVEVVRWIDDAHLRVRVSGHGDHQSFDRTFTVTVRRQRPGQAAPYR